VVHGYRLVTQVKKCLRSQEMELRETANNASLAQFIYGGASDLDNPIMLASSLGITCQSKLGWEHQIHCRHQGGLVLAFSEELLSLVELVMIYVYLGFN
jgi:hypothetical protein